MVDRGATMPGRAASDVACCDVGEEAWCDEALRWVDEIGDAHKAFGDDHVVSCRCTPTPGWPAASTKQPDSKSGGLRRGLATSREAVTGYQPDIYAVFNGATTIKAPRGISGGYKIAAMSQQSAPEHPLDSLLRNCRQR